MHISERSIWPKAKPWRRQQTTCREVKAFRNTTEVDTRPQQSHPLRSSKGLPLSLNRNPFKRPSKLRGLLGLHFLSFWPFGPSSGLRQQCGLSFPFILAFWRWISFHFGLLGFHFFGFWPFWPSFPFILAFWPFISFHFRLLGLQFLSFWPFGSFISFHFGFLSLHFLSFWPFGQYFLSFCVVWAATWGPTHKLPKMARFLNVRHKEFNSARSGYIFQFSFILAF